MPPPIATTNQAGARNNCSYSSVGSRRKAGRMAEKIINTPAPNNGKSTRIVTMSLSEIVDLLHQVWFAAKLNIHD